MTAADALTEVNPHALSAIVQASATRTIVASQDIYDDQGRKLWARDQAVSVSLQLRLLERKLSQPLEACLRAADGVTTLQLHEAAMAFLDAPSPLVEVIKPHATEVLKAVGQLPLHSAVQLLLTTVHATRPEMFAHAVRAMLLAGAISADAGQQRFDLRMALLAGLLHDLGEMYLDPAYLDSPQPLDLTGYRQVVSHPLIARMLLVRLTDYPPALSEALAEHHERLDGTGYPGRKVAAALAPLGRLAAVVEAAVGMMGAPHAPLTRAALALRMVPGEFDAALTSVLVNAARRASEDLEQAVASHDANVVQLQRADGLDRLDAALGVARHLASGPVARNPALAEVLERAAHRLLRMKVAGHTVGLWTLPDGGQTLPERLELAVAIGEMRYRLRGIERDCLWSSPTLKPAELEALSPLWQALSTDRDRP